MYKIINPVTSFLSYFHNYLYDNTKVVSLYASNPEDYANALKAYTNYEGLKGDKPDNTVRYPFIAYSRTQTGLLPAKSNLNRGTYTKRYTDSNGSSSMLKYTIVPVSFEFNPVIYFSDIKELQEYEILILGGKFITNLKQFEIEDNFFGKLPVQIDWSLNNISYNVGTNKYFSLRLSGKVIMTSVIIEADKSDFIQEIDFTLKEETTAEILWREDFNSRFRLPYIEIMDYNVVTGDDMYPRVPISKLKATIHFNDNPPEDDIVCEIEDLDGNSFKVIPPQELLDMTEVRPYILQVRYVNSKDREFVFNKTINPEPAPAKYQLITFTELLNTPGGQEEYELATTLDYNLWGDVNPKYLKVRVNNIPMPYNSYYVTKNQDRTYTLHLKSQFNEAMFTEESIINVEYLIELS